MSDRCAPKAVIAWPGIRMAVEGRLGKFGDQPGRAVCRQPTDILVRPSSLIQAATREDS
ncbi:hypothetical protein BCAR13_1440009 [Paraburkholderia caribensis]|nr:hypothetical protein BCAR13_1440009 [Paraburkholderia caribensis]